jgi:hypothetical protein
VDGIAHLAQVGFIGGTHKFHESVGSHGLLDRHRTRVSCVAVRCARLVSSVRSLKLAPVDIAYGISCKSYMTGTCRVPPQSLLMLEYLVTRWWLGWIKRWARFGVGCWLASCRFGQISQAPGMLDEIKAELLVGWSTPPIHTQRTEISLFSMCTFASAPGTNTHKTPSHPSQFEQIRTGQAIIS